MFLKPKVILYITKTHIAAIQVTLGKQPREKQIAVIEWTSESLTAKLAALKKNIKSNVRLLLDEDLAYVITVSQSLTGQNKREFIQEKAQELIPEDLNETIWDFKEVLALPSSKKETPTKIVQVIAVVESFYKQLQNALQKSGLKIEAAEPLSYALSQTTKHSDIPLIIAYSTHKPLLILSVKGVVIATQRLSVELTPQKIQEFYELAKQKYSITPQKIVFCGKVEGIDLKSYVSDTLKGEIRKISPYITLALKKDLKGTDENVLNLEFLTVITSSEKNIIHNKKTKPDLDTAQPEGLNTTDLKEDTTKPDLSSDLQNVSPTQEGEPNTQADKSILYIIALGICTMLVVGLVAFFIMTSMNSNGNNTEKNTAPKENPLPKTTSESASESAEIKLDEYSIIILNGSGTAGVATKLSTILKDKGFLVEKTGNATRFDYSQTEIAYKNNVPQDFKTALDKTVQELYDNTVERKLQDSEEADVQIIISTN